MDRIQFTLAFVAATMTAAVTYVKANTGPLEASTLTADVFTCQQSPQAGYEPRFRLTSGPAASSYPSCLHMTN